MANSKINKGAATDRLVKKLENSNLAVALKGKLSAPIRSKKTFETNKLKLNSIPVSIVSSLNTGLGTKLHKGQLVRAHNRQRNVSRPLKKTAEEDFVDNNFETFKRDIISRCDRLESRNGTRPMSVAISVRETVEICSNGESENIIDFNKEQWNSMNDQEKNKWIKRYLYKIKREILVVYRMILDYRGGDVLEDELSELSSISSMIDIKPNENLNFTTVQNDYLTAMVQLKELQERHKEMLITLEDTKNDNAAMFARINVEKTDQEIQTDGVRVEIIERDLDNARGEISSMYSKMEITDDLVISLRRELKEKVRELKETKSAVMNLRSQIEYLTKTIDEANVNISNRQRRIEVLSEEKNKLKAEFAEANKERNEATEELIVLKNNSEKMMKELKDLRMKVNEKRSEYVVDSMRLSSQIDEINEKNDKIKKMEAIISKHEDLINNLTTDSIEQNQKIISLEAKKISLEDELRTWENRAGCWINTFVRDEFESTINKQKKEIENLTLLTNRLRSAYKISVSEINELEDNHKKIIQVKQQIIDKQNRVIALVKGLSPYQSKEFVQNKVQDTLKEMFVKYEDDKALADKLEESLIENSRLQRLVDDYKLRLNSAEAKLT